MTYRTGLLQISVTALLCQTEFFARRVRMQAGR